MLDSGCRLHFYARTKWDWNAWLSCLADWKNGIVMRMKQQLMRRYIGKRLADYYAQPANRVVGKVVSAETAKLSSLLGEWHWRRVLGKYYEEREGHWLTPVELFQPHFSRVLADFCCQAVDVSPPDGGNGLEIVELGGGRGTNAKLVLSYLQEHRPDVYEGLTYILVDSSPSLNLLQKKELASSGHTDKVKFQLTDLVDVAEKKASLVEKSDARTVFVAMEVLDNLPHDKIRAKSRKQVEQAEVRKTIEELDEEVFVPMQDPLLAEIVKIVPSYMKSYPTWVPSVACGVIDHVIARRPNLGLVFADFDWLPAADLSESSPPRLSIWGEGEPIITDMSGFDHECYLRAPPHCDILFPTDFDKLGSYAKRKLMRSRKSDAITSMQTQKQSEFLEMYGRLHVNKTKSWLTGHTPLLDDFVNCSVLSLMTTARE